MEPVLLLVLPSLLLLILATITDVKARVIPNRLLLPFFVFFVLVEVFYMHTPVMTLLGNMIVPVLPLYLVTLIKEGTIGGGDLKLVIVLGSALGVGLTLAILVLAFIALLLYAYDRKLDKQAALPFAPFLLGAGSLVLIPFALYQFALAMFPLFFPRSYHLIL